MCLAEMCDIVQDTGHNVMDHLKGMALADIEYSLRKDRTNLSILIDNQTKNLNAGTIVRSAHCFLCERTVFYGRKNYNRKPALYSYKFENIDLCPDIDSLKAWISRQGIVRVVGLDNNITRDTIPLPHYNWLPEVKYLLALGNEGQGLAPEILDICDDIVEIPQLGAVRSLNVSTAATTAMYDYCVKTRRFK